MEDDGFLAWVTTGGRPMVILDWGLTIAFQVILIGVAIHLVR
jgi:hypothetical protein